MTVKTKFVTAFDQEFRILRRMWVMTLVAHPVLERHVLHGAAGLKIVMRMTLRAEVSYGAFLHAKGLVSVRRVMAHIAASRDNGIVRARLHEFRLVRGMGIVTDRAGFCLHWIIAMSLL